MKKYILHTIKHYKHVLYSNSKRGIRHTLNAKINELSIALNDLQQKNDAKTAELSNALSNQQQEIQTLNFVIDNLFMEEHISKIKCTKLPNALISYVYNDGKVADGYYNPNMMNIGDYVQSVAAKQFLPKVDGYIDRDALSEYTGTKVNLIMNAWWYMFDKNKRFSTKINPLFVSFHLNNTESVLQETLDYLKQNEPIGCRDYNTRNFLLSHDIEAYFSGCLTLTLGNTYNVSESKRKKEIFFVDYDLDNEQDIQIKKNIENILKNYKDCDIKKESHVCDFNSDINGNFKTAESLLDKYSKASLVITTRLHCALPCLAMHTPVIFVIPGYDEKRYRGLLDLLNVIGKDKSGHFMNTIKKVNNLVVNTDKYTIFANNLNFICKKFTGKNNKQ